MTTAVKLIESIPIYDDTSEQHDSSSDWPDCEYSAVVTTAPDGGWIVKHQLSGAPGIEALIQSGCAQYAVEKRIVEALHSALETSGEDDQRVGDDAALGGSMWLWPGVVTIRDCDFDVSGSAWPEGVIPVSAGRWLVRGAPVRVEDSGRSLLRLQYEDEAPEGRATIRVESADQDICVVIRARRDLIDEIRHNPPALTACWATALAMLRGNQTFAITDEDGIKKVEGSANGYALLRDLEAHDVPLWDDEEAWDPMLAATVRLPLSTTAGPTDDEDNSRGE